MFKHVGNALQAVMTRTVLAYRGVPRTAVGDVAVCSHRAVLRVQHPVEMQGVTNGSDGLPHLYQYLDHLRLYIPENRDVL